MTTALQEPPAQTVSAHAQRLRRFAAAMTDRKIDSVTGCGGWPGVRGFDLIPQIRGVDSRAE